MQPELSISVLENKDFVEIKDFSVENQRYISVEKDLDIWKLDEEKIDQSNLCLFCIQSFIVDFFTLGRRQMIDTVGLLEGSRKQEIK